MNTHGKKVQKQKFGREWDGDVEGYLENSDIDLDEYRMVRGGHIIHNLPEEAIILEKDGKPVEFGWRKRYNKKLEIITPAFFLLFFCLCFSPFRLFFKFYSLSIL